MGGQGKTVRVCVDAGVDASRASWGRVLCAFPLLPLPAGALACSLTRR